jgi:hypothetical protein
MMKLLTKALTNLGLFEVGRYPAVNMNYEMPTPIPRRPYEIFDITEDESLRSRVSHDRFIEILDNERTLVHRLEDQSNGFGEFLFITLSRMEERSRVVMTSYGLGYHEYRLRWLTDDWNLQPIRIIVRIFFVYGAVGESMINRLNIETERIIVLNNLSALVKSLSPVIK